MFKVQGSMLKSLVNLNVQPELCGDPSHCETPPFSYQISGLAPNLRVFLELVNLPMGMDARLRKGIDLFNDGRFFESHEILEGFYQDTEDPHRPFLEGLIQLAVAFRMFKEFGELKGPVRMIYQALIRFENYQTAFLQIRVSELSANMEAWAKAAEAASTAPMPQPIPKIPLQRFSFFS